jgi:hypothetical protein
MYNIPAIFMRDFTYKPVFFKYVFIKHKFPPQRK